MLPLSDLLRLSRELTLLAGLTVSVESKLIEYRCCWENLGSLRHDLGVLWMLLVLVSRLSWYFSPLECLTPFDASCSSSSSSSSSSSTVRETSDGLSVTAEEQEHEHEQEDDESDKDELRPKMTSLESSGSGAELERR